MTRLAQTRARGDPRRDPPVNTNIERRRYAMTNPVYLETMTASRGTFLNPNLGASLERCGIDPKVCGMVLVLCATLEGIPQTYIAASSIHWTGGRGYQCLVYYSPCIVRLDTESSGAPSPARIPTLSLRRGGKPLEQPIKQTLALSVGQTSRCPKYNAPDEFRQQCNSIVQGFPSSLPTS